ncbi:hypothetical protein Poly24_23350 [Rosistilla carotiformis]|uniref:ArnR1-like winged helix-turn-helix domain-containing protein n=1 Tax=Rosistilla carotiformis TaxID=2528017 RepID=A0A518JSW6_9BACT|nr:hypothetical protein [Rosistilla carotiformis]QDV68625.1 hypothetical protein Poly24_23350 [Rosistilla carotiformis]
MPVVREQTFTKSEQSVLKTFREFLMSPGQMLCFYGPELERYRNALKGLTERGLLVKERFKGAYSLTREGFAAMRSVHPHLA